MRAVSSSSSSQFRFLCSPRLPALADEADRQPDELGGLALAIGILVDMATVTIENLHTHMP